MIRTVIYLQPKDGDEQGVIDYFLGQQVLEHSAEVEGFISSELFRPHSGGPMLVTATWESPEAYQRWLDHPWRAESNIRINEVLDGGIEVGTKGDIYELVHKVVK